MEELLKLFVQFSALVKNAFEDDSRSLTSRDKVSELQEEWRIYIYYLYYLYHLYPVHLVCIMFLIFLLPGIQESSGISRLLSLVGQ